MKLKYPLILLGLVVLSGCGVEPPLQGRQDPYPPPQITFVDGDLRKMTPVGMPILTRDEGGLLHVAVPIRADTDRTLFIDYRATFVDRNGQLLSQSSWLPKVLSPHVPDQIMVNSMSPRAADFQLDIRYSK